MSDPPEITTACWGILDKDPNELMCASQRMVVKRKGAKSPAVVACTLLPYDKQFELVKHYKRLVKVCRSTILIAQVFVCSAAAAVRPKISRFLIQNSAVDRSRPAPSWSLLNERASPSVSGVIWPV